MLRSTKAPIALALAAALAAACIPERSEAPPPQMGGAYAGGYAGYPPPPQGGYPSGYGPPPYGQPAPGAPPGYSAPPGAPPPGAPPPGAPPTAAPPGAPPPGATVPGPAPAPPPPGPAPGGQPPPPGSAPPPGGGFPFPIPGLPQPGGGGGQQGGGGAAGTATPIDPNVATVATGPLVLFAQQEAPGMQREGPVVAAQFQEGQILEQPIQILPGKCYTVLAVGAGIQEMDITLIATTPVPGLSPILAQDGGSGNQASLGGRGNCFKWSAPFGINAKYVLKATRGSGVAAGQLFVK